MQRRLETLIGALDAVSDRDGLGSAILGLRDIFEVDHVIYHAVSRIGEEFAAASYSEEWQLHYATAGLTKIDPVVRGCQQSSGLVRWDRLDWSTKTASAMMSDAIEAGVGNQGISLPIRGPDGQFAVFSLSHTASNEAWEYQVNDLISDTILVSHYINQKALEVVDGADGHPVGQLSPRESDALSLLAVGMNRAQASDYLGISEHTLRVYIENARMKVGATNTVHAVARAMSLGMLTI